MINITKYINSKDIKEFHLNQAMISMLTVTKCVSEYRSKTFEMNEDKPVNGNLEPIYDDSKSCVKMIVSGTPLEVTVPNDELDEFLKPFNLEGRE